MNEQLKELKRKTKIKLGISGFLMGILLGLFQGSGVLMGILFFVLIFVNIGYIEYISYNEGWNECKIKAKTINFLYTLLSYPADEVIDTNDENKKIFIYDWWGPDEAELDIISNHGIVFIYNDEIYRTIDADEFTLADENKIRIFAKRDELFKGIKI